MNVLVLGNQSSAIRKIIEDDGHGVMVWTGPVDIRFLENHKIEFIVSYGYRHLITQAMLDHLPGRIVNLHISYLPWNRGADPNLWSFLEDTPKGVSIHLIDRGIDTGDIVVQQKVTLREDDRETLSTTYQTLHDEMAGIFRDQWADIRTGNRKGSKQPPGGSFHKSSDKERFSHLLIKGWDTPIRFLKGAALAGTSAGRHS